MVYRNYRIYSYSLYIKWRCSGTNKLKTKFFSRSNSGDQGNRAQKANCYVWQKIKKINCKCNDKIKMYFYKEFTWIIKNYSSKTSFCRRKKDIVNASLTTPMQSGGSIKTLQTSFRKTLPGKALKGFFPPLHFAVWKRELQTIPDIWRSLQHLCSLKRGCFFARCPYWRSFHYAHCALHQGGSTSRGKNKNS